MERGGPSTLRPEDVTADTLGSYRFYQPRRGYRFSIDSVLLAFFASVVQGPVVDLGAGCGVLSVLLFSRGARGPFVAVEIDPLAAACCEANFSAAGVEGLVLNQDLLEDHPRLEAEAFSMVITNPPFGRKGHGRLPPDPARARARHELELSAPALWRRAAELLRPGGRLAFCWPPGRLVEALVTLKAVGLVPKRLRSVHGRVELGARVVLVEAIKGGGEGLEIAAPLVVYSSPGVYTPEVQAYYDSLIRA